MPPKLKFEVTPPSDPELDFMSNVEEQLGEFLSANRFTKIRVEVDTWDDGRQFITLPKVPPQDFDKVLEWLHDLDVERVVSVGFKGL